MGAGFAVRCNNALHGSAAPEGKENRAVSFPIELKLLHNNLYLRKLTMEDRIKELERIVEGLTADVTALNIVMTEYLSVQECMPDSPKFKRVIEAWKQRASDDSKWPPGVEKSLGRMLANIEKSVALVDEKLRTLPREPLRDSD